MALSYFGKVLILLNLFFHATHILIITFTLIGWAFKRTRFIHLLVVLLTLLSWIGLGFFYGWGYCFWTDWHWQVREQLGKPYPASYIKLLADLVTGSNWEASLIDIITVVVFVFVVCVTLIVNFRPDRATS